MTGCRCSASHTAALPLTVVPTRTLAEPASVTLRTGSEPPTVSAPGNLAPIAPSVTTTPPGYITAGASTGGTTPLAAGRHTSAVPGQIQVMNPAEQAQVDTMLAAVRKSPTGAPVLDQLQRTGLRIDVMSANEFSAVDKEGAGALYDAEKDVMYLRQDWLQTKPAAVNASAFVHEGVHALDDASGLLDGARLASAHRLALLPGDPSSQRGAIAQEKHQLRIAAEARAFLVQGQVLRELGAADRAGGPIAVAAAGHNDQATYNQVYSALETMGGDVYNPEQLTTTPWAL